MRLHKYQQFRGKGFAKKSRPDDVNSAFFNWQLTHDAEQEEDGRPDVWPQLYRDSRDFQEKKRLVKLSPLEHLQQIHSATLSEADLAQLELSIWASNEETTRTSMCLACHDELGFGPRPDGFCRPVERRPSATRGCVAAKRVKSHWSPLLHSILWRTPIQEAVCPWSFLPGRRGPKDRVVFAYNLHTLPVDNACKLGEDDALRCTNKGLSRIPASACRRKVRNAFCTGQHRCIHMCSRRSPRTSRSSGIEISKPVPGHAVVTSLHLRALGWVTVAFP